MAVIEAQTSSDTIARLIEVMQSHEIAELEAIAVYRDLARRTTDPVIAGLLHALLRDEEHHHRILRAIGMDLRAVADGANPAVPRPRDRAALESLELLQAFARQEHDGAQELQRLANQAPALLGGLFALLLELMALDSTKHRMILLYIARELSGELAAPDGDDPTPGVTAGC
jgi:hypothetical protein